MYQDTNSTWDYENHVAIPTLQYIQSITGYDLNTLGDSVPLSTESRVKGLTIKATRFLLSTKENTMTKNILIYLVATNENYRRAYLNYVVTYIEQTFIDPSWENVPREIKDAINGSILKAQEFTGQILSEYLSTEEVW